MHQKGISIDVLQMVFDWHPLQHRQFVEVVTYELT